MSAGDIFTRDADKRIAELEKELKWLQSQHVRVCSNEDKLRKLAQAAVDAREADLIRADGCLPTTAQSKAIDALAKHLEVTK